jgi:pyrimidine operon attenuation protein / uracil phosphoribosyltransferase
MAVHESIVILDQTQIEQKINRLAYQIYEQNFEEKHIVVCGIPERGYLLAKKIHSKLSEIADFEVELCTLKFDKRNLQAGIEITPNPADLQNKSVILCDDVLYTGKTLAYAAIPFLSAGAKKVQCLVLIQRNHLNFPVQPTYVGLSLATTLQEHVSVQLAEGSTEQVVLS